MVEKTLSDLFLAQLKDIYYAEKKIFRTLPKMVKAAQVPALKQAFTAHREETQGQIVRLSPRNPSSTTRIFSSAEKCRRVARRMSLIASSAGCFSGLDFCLIFAPCGYDDPEILPS